MLYKSHLVSQVLLRRFSNNGYVSVFNKLTASNLTKSTREVAWIQLPKEGYAILEKKWGKTEGSISESYEMLDSGKLLKSKKHINMVKKFMVMHYIRSAAMIQLFGIKEQEYFNKLIDDSLNAHPYRKTDILRNVQAIRRKWTTSLVLEKLPALIDTLTTKIEAFVERHDLEIGIPDSPNKDFILSDIPVWNGVKGGKAGIINGVSIDASDAVVLPLGPKFIASLITHRKSDDYLKLSDKQVDTANIKMIQLSLFEFYSRPTQL